MGIRACRKPINKKMSIHDAHIPWVSLLVGDMYGTNIPILSQLTQECCRKTGKKQRYSRKKTFDGKNEEIGTEPIGRKSPELIINRGNASRKDGDPMGKKEILLEYGAMCIILG